MSIIYSNLIKVIGDNIDIKKIFSDYLDTNGFLDFNLIIPLNDVYSRHESLEKWGCRDNAYKTIIGNDYIYFNTDNDTPRKILIEISKKYQDVTFEIQYAGQGFNLYCGILTIKNEHILEVKSIINDHEENREEIRKWREFYFNLIKIENKNITLQDCGFNEYFEYI